MAEFIDSIFDNEKVNDNKMTLVNGLISNNLKGLLKSVIGFDFKDQNKLDLIRSNLGNFIWALDFIIKFNIGNQVDNKLR